MKKIVALLLLFVNILFGESRYVCTLKQLYDAYSFNTYSKFGTVAVDTMVLTLNNNTLTHNFKDVNKKDAQVKYEKKSEGTTTVLTGTVLEKVKYTEYQQNSSTPIIIYSFDNFNKMIRINMETVGTYSCTKF